MDRVGHFHFSKDVCVDKIGRFRSSFTPYCRAKSLDGRWVYGVVVESVNDRYYMIHGATEDAVNTSNEVDFIYTEVDGSTIGLCVQRFDKDKTLIFAGDIIQWPENVVGLWVDQVGKREVVKFPFICGNAYKSKVVGNIVDNPGLIE